MPDSAGRLSFAEVFTEELDDVIARREAARLADAETAAVLRQRAAALAEHRPRLVALAAQAEDAGGGRAADPPGESAFDRARLVGLALSGGGIRSATFNLGALQALHQAGAFAKVDYLSTVSGGGYIGSCLSSYFTAPAAEAVGFPFAHNVGQRENAAFVHLRDHANYLAPRGLRDKLVFPALFFRGLLLNLLVVLPLLLVLAVLTVLWVAPRLQTALAIPDGKALLSWNGFIGTIAVGGAFLVLLLAVPAVHFVSAILQLNTWRNRTRVFRFMGTFLAAVPVVAFVELQPYAIYWATQWTGGGGSLTQDVKELVSYLIGIGATLSAALSQ